MRNHIVNKAEIDVFLELSCFFHDSADVGNLISGSSAFSKTILNIWNFMVHVLLKPGLDVKVPHSICQQIWCFIVAAAAAKSLQSCLTLCDPIDGSPPGSPVPGILQARTLERVGISSRGFSRQEYWSG